MKESDLQKAIIDYLRIKKFVVVKFPSVGIWRKDTQSYIKQPRRGVSDIDFQDRFDMIKVWLKRNVNNVMALLNKIQGGAYLKNSVRGDVIGFFVKKIFPLPFVMFAVRRLEENLVGLKKLKILPVAMFVDGCFIKEPY